MATPSEKLATSLEALKDLQEQGKTAIRSRDLSRIDRERLLENWFLREVIKGWYIPSRPDEIVGASTAWYASFWRFCADYLHHRFGNDWCLSPEQSLCLHAGNWQVPRQLLVRAPKGRNKPTHLLYDTSLFDIRSDKRPPSDVTQKDGLQLFALPAALIACSPSYFKQDPTDARTALASINNAAEILSRLLEGGHSIIAGRLAGAFRNIGRDRIADDIVDTMRSAGFKIREQDPFTTQSTPLGTRQTSPHVNRLGLMWQQMREPVLASFPPPQQLPNDTASYLERVQETYVTDAYHSLSIEGYRVNRDIIERVRSGAWNPDNSEQDQHHRDALAARGYWQAYQAVRSSLQRILQGENAGTVVEKDLSTWYREMFAPSVTAGILRPAELAGYRNSQVFIRGSMHIPLRTEAVVDAMSALFDLLREEKEPAVRIVLGHFVFVYIHPYMDGNGRLGRFLMNTMLASGGYPWITIPVESRTDYMTALEAASVQQDIKPFTQLLADLTTEALRGQPTATPPA